MATQKLPSNPSGNPFRFSESTTVTFEPDMYGAKTADLLRQRYVPLRKIAEGGMGQIFAVQERLSGRIVALKVMTHATQSKPHFVQQFMREAVITARLQHPHIIPVHELGFLMERQQLYYTMRFVDGAPFSESRVHISQADQLEILLKAASAVEAAHEQGLWHRDLKPDNILVGKDGGVYVIDWGVVTVQRGANYELALPDLVVARDIVPMSDPMPDLLLKQTANALTTHNGICIGTPKYMAPEQLSANDAEMGVVSDVWAFGLMLYETLTGRHPYPDMNFSKPGQALAHLMENEIVDPKTINPHIPGKLAVLCSRMLRKEPASRLSSLRLFIDTLRGFLDSSAKSATISGQIPTITPLPFSTLRTPTPEAQGSIMIASPTERTVLSSPPQQTLQCIESPSSSSHTPGALEVSRLERKLAICLEIMKLRWWQYRKRRDLLMGLAML